MIGEFGCLVYMIVDIYIGVIRDPFIYNAFSRELCPNIGVLNFPGNAKRNVNILETGKAR